MGAVILAKDNHKRASGGYGGEVRVRHHIALATDHADLVGVEPFRHVELSNGLHDPTLRCIPAFFEPVKRSSGGGSHTFASFAKTRNPNSEGSPKSESRKGEFGSHTQIRI